MYWLGNQGDYIIMVMELLGPSLESLLAFCEKKLSVKTVTMLAIQMVKTVNIHLLDWPD